MKFQFHIHLGEQDYMDFNRFWMLQSPYGKKSMRSTYKTVILICLMILILYGWMSDISLVTWLILCAVCMGLVLLLMKPLMKNSVKTQIKRRKESGKLPYAADAEISFFDDYFMEITPAGKSEIQYTALERISYIPRKIIYLHYNNTSAYLIPETTFVSAQERVSFLEFIKTKCENFDIYS